MEVPLWYDQFHFAVLRISEMASCEYANALGFLYSLCSLKISAEVPLWCDQFHFAVLRISEMEVPLWCDHTDELIYGRAL